MSQSLTERYDERIAGMLSCYDRLENWQASVGIVSVAAKPQCGQVIVESAIMVGPLSPTCVGHNHPSVTRLAGQVMKSMEL
jgi:hypothetical protein